MRLTVLFRALFVTVVLGGVLVGTAHQASALPPAYPTTLPNFGHHSSPHETYFSSKVSMQNHPEGDVPMLVIAVRAQDQAVPAGGMTAWMEQRYFGYRPSVRDYLQTVSRGQLSLGRAKESQGTPNDGIVEVTTPTLASFMAIGPGDEAWQGLRLANRYVNFEDFDRNDDEYITRDELVVVVVRNGSGNCGATRYRGSTDGFVGSDLDDMVVYFGGTAVGTGTNIVTSAHEIGHQILEVRDDYNLGIPHLSLGSDTCYDDNSTWYPAAWERSHWGWAVPTVLTRDGFRTVGDATTSQPFLMYDPARGTDDYFLVENRQANPATYDQTPEDQGLVMWRMTENAWNNTPTNFYSLVSPTGGLAWDPDRTATRDQRTASAPWSDGTPSNLAMRAISRNNTGGTQAYFDVRGPGILVDGRAARQNLITMKPNERTTLQIPVRNTQDLGEASDSFSFTASGPLGWTATTQTKQLAPQRDDTATIEITAPLNAPAGNHTIYLKGTSTSDPSITSFDAITIQVRSVGRAQVIGDKVHFVAGPGARNSVSAYLVGSGYEISDGGGDIVAGPGCRYVYVWRVACSSVGTPLTGVRFDGGDLDDTLTGGTGNDVLIGGTGADVLTGGGGTDTADYSGDAFRTAGVTVVLDDLVNDGTQGSERDNVRADVENVIGTPFTDNLTGSTAANVLDGGNGDDIISAGNGNDTVLGDGGRDTLTGGSGTDVLDGGNADDTIRGGADRDDLRGGYGTDRLYGEAGNDVLDGGGGYDGLGGPDDKGDYLSGGADADWLSYRSHYYGVTITLDGAANDGVAGHGEADNVQNDIEDVTGTRYGDSLIGNSAANKLFGTEGDDMIRGGSGNDMLYGEGGRDSVYGQDGVDTLYVAHNDVDAVVDCGTGWDTAHRDTIDPWAPTCELP